MVFFERVERAGLEQLDLLAAAGLDAVLLHRAAEAVPNRTCRLCSAASVSNSSGGKP